MPGTRALLRQACLLLLLLTARAAVLRGQASAEAAPPCAHPTILQARERNAAVRMPLLYDGIAPLARAPAAQIPLPAVIPSPVCVLLSVQFGQRDGAVFVEDAGLVTVSHPALALQLRRTDYARQVVAGATQVLRDALHQELFGARPRVGTRYMVAIPVTPAHPLYAGQTAAAAPAPSGTAGTLDARGYPGAVLVRAAGDLAIWFLGEVGYRRHYAVVRTIAPDEPILDYVTGTSQSGLRTARYGAGTETRFLTQVVPVLREQGGVFIDVTVHHFARGVTIDRQPDSRFPWNGERHFRTGAPVEVPVAVERWVGRRPAPGGAWTWTSEGASATDLNTLAAIQAVQRGIAAQQAVYATNRAAMYAREAQALEARRTARRTREAERQRLITAAGLLYLPATTWTRYQLGPEMRAVFDGSWPGATSQWEFGSIYSRTIRAFSNRCRRLIPRGSPMITSKWITRDAAGNRWSSDGSDTTFILSAFAEPFRWWETNAPQALPLAPGGLSARTIDDVMALLRTLTNPAQALSATALLVKVEVAMREDMAVLFEGGCEAPVVQQFMENMRRLALRLPTLQMERAPRSVLTAAEWPPTIAQACQREVAERGAQVGREWCPCLERQFTQVLTLGEQWNAVEDYSTFFDEVDGFRTGPDGRPVWARYTPANACRR
ncbi:MAG: hypothetical protein IT355_15015 [Gemmatimonadaceae bacterium]|nr:hypothetical protein [Gemmatimonadaceae bacterium]